MSLDCTKQILIVDHGPKQPNSLTRRLKPILSNLREGLGIHVVIGRQTTEDSKKKKNTCTIRIERISPLYLLHPPEQDYARNQTKSGGGSEKDGDTTSTLELIPPPESGINRAQKTQSGDSGDSGDIIPTLGMNTEISDLSPLTSACVAFDFEWSPCNTIIVNGTVAFFYSLFFSNRFEKSLYTSCYVISCICR